MFLSADTKARGARRTNARCTETTAHEAAAGKNLEVFSPTIGRQLLAIGLIDEIDLYIVPILLGDGIRLYDNPGSEPIRLHQLGATADRGRERSVPTRRLGAGPDLASCRIPVMDWEDVRQPRLGHLLT